MVAQQKEIGIQHIKSFREFHQFLFDEFIQFKDYDKLEEYINLFLIIKDLQKSVKNNTLAYSLLQTYIVHVKTTARSFYDLAEQYNYDEYFIIDEYIDQALAL